MDPMGNVQVDLAQKIRVPIAALLKSTLFLARFRREVSGSRWLKLAESQWGCTCAHGGWNLGILLHVPLHTPKYNGNNNEKTTYQTSHYMDTDIYIYMQL